MRMLRSTRYSSMFCEGALCTGSNGSRRRTPRIASSAAWGSELSFWGMLSAQINLVSANLIISCSDRLLSALNASYRVHNLIHIQHLQRARKHQTEQTYKGRPKRHMNDTWCNSSRVTSSMGNSG